MHDMFFLLSTLYTNSLYVMTCKVAMLDLFLERAKDSHSVLGH